MFSLPGDWQRIAKLVGVITVINLLMNEVGVAWILIWANIKNYLITLPVVIIA